MTNMKIIDVKKLSNEQLLKEIEELADSDLMTSDSGLTEWFQNHLANHYKRVLHETARRFRGVE